jgi:hypothetical protein
MYNEALTNFLTLIFTFSIGISAIVGLLYGIVNTNVEPIRFSDKFDIGYIRDVADPEDEIVTAAVVTEAVVKPEPVKKEESPILQDCVDFLVVMGVPKRKAKAQAKQLVEDNDITTVEDFIKEYTKK